MYDCAVVYKGSRIYSTKSLQYLRHLTYQESGVSRTRIREGIKIVRFQDARFVVLTIFEILITCQSKDL